MIEHVESNEENLFDGKDHVAGATRELLGYRTNVSLFISFE